ncbi:cell division protein FtsQ/DivIB [Frigidibacter sp.]|uniref:cell division protein FtsQ/DivIB n=1 Tax=Frigidibacter sp. TaxID=2586418 RepID=UPI0027377149|nr:cell division protein FtsQ/DivIB [Frigidibacter sp.]MDP3341094.1 cell division protein FtsQ/DivIB [Frigidibacter sp.]
MQQVTAPLRRDPAPSRAAYRMHRLWLTPVFRALLRVGVPAFVVTMGFGLYLSDDTRRAALGDKVAAMTKSVQERPEFMVTLMAVDGASEPLAAAIRNLVVVEFPVSSFSLDLEAMRAQIETIDAVKSADLRIRAGGILQVDVTERDPAMVWRSAQGLFLLDETGHRIAGLTVRDARPDLALVAGDGADKAVPEALALMAAAGPIAGRIRGLVRMGERRWDLVLDREQRIQLPEDEPVAALERVIALDQAEDILERDLTVVDMRNMQRPTLRLAGDALARLRGEDLKPATRVAGELAGN